jgi:hypothetical protein
MYGWTKNEHGATVSDCIPMYLCTAPAQEIGSIFAQQRVLLQFEVWSKKERQRERGGRVRILIACSKT